MPKPPRIRHQRQNIPKLWLLWTPPARHRRMIQLQLHTHPAAPRPPSHPSEHCHLGHGAPCGQRGERARNCKRRRHKAAQEEMDSGAPGKRGRNTTARRRFLWEAQSQVLFSKAPFLHTQEDRLGQKQELPLMPLSGL